MMRAFYTVIILMVIVSCRNEKGKLPETGNDQEIEISGQLTGGAGTLVTLDLMGPVSFLPVDSVRCDEEGRFSIRFAGEGMNYYSLKYTDHGYVTIIAKPGEKIILRGSADSIYPYTIKGSDASDLVRTLATRHKKVLDQLSEISAKSQQLAGSPGYRQQKAALNQAFDSLTYAFYEYSRDYLYKHSGSPAMLIALYNQFGPGLPVFDPLEDLEIYRYTDSVLYNKYPENEAVAALHGELNAAMQQMRNPEKRRQVAVGSRAPDFVTSTPEGTKIALSEFDDRYVILQFWASWSLPSVEENKTLEEVYALFREEELAIFQVSLDSDRGKWTGAIQGSMKQWNHGSDLLRWESPVVHLYDVERIPANFLVNPEGFIVETDIFGEEMIEVLKKYIREK